MALKTYLHGQGDIDFMLHGGDMINTLSEAEIIAAVTAFDWDIPVHLCLGNHDLDAPTAVERWLALAPRFLATAASRCTPLPQKIAAFTWFPIIGARNHTTGVIH